MSQIHTSQTSIVPSPAVGARAVRFAARKSNRGLHASIGSVIVAATVALIVSSALAADNASRPVAIARADSLAPVASEVAVATPVRNGRVQLARLPWPAPVGHRQPRVSDVPAEGLSGLERERWLDRELDRKLVICRGC